MAFKNKKSRANLGVKGTSCLSLSLYVCAKKRVVSAKLSVLVALQRVLVERGYGFVVLQLKGNALGEGVEDVGLLLHVLL